MLSGPAGQTLALLSPRLGPPDLAIIGFYLAGVTIFGLRFRSRNRSLKTYFLADQKVPWWAIALSIVSAETSALTIISVPGLAFTGDWGFLQIVLGYLLGRIVVCILFLPARPFSSRGRVRFSVYAHGRRWR